MFDLVVAKQVMDFKPGWFLAKLFMLPGLINPVLIPYARIISIR